MKVSKIHSTKVVIALSFIVLFVTSLIVDSSAFQKGNHNTTIIESSVLDDQENDNHVYSFFNEWLKDPRFKAAYDNSIQLASQGEGSSVNKSAFSDIETQQFNPDLTLSIQGQVFEKTSYTGQPNTSTPLPFAFIIAMNLDSRTQSNFTLINFFGFAITNFTGHYEMQNMAPSFMILAPRIMYFVIPIYDPESGFVSPYGSSTYTRQLGLTSENAYQLRNETILAYQSVVPLALLGLGHITFVPGGSYRTIEDEPGITNEYISAFKILFRDPETREVLLDLSLVFTPWMSTNGYSDVFWWAPVLNKTLEVNLYYYVKEGWVDSTIFLNGTNLTALNTLSISMVNNYAEEKLTETKKYFKENEDLGFDLDPYKDYIRDAEAYFTKSEEAKQLTYDFLLDKNNLASIGFAYIVGQSLALELGPFIDTMLVNAELSLINSVYAYTLANLHLSHLTEDSMPRYTWILLLTMAILAVPVSFLFEENEKKQLIIRFLLSILLMALIMLVHPLLRKHFFEETFNLDDLGVSLDRDIAFGYLYSLGIVALVLLPNLLSLLKRIPRYERMFTLTGLSLRNLKRRFRATLLLVTTLTITISFFIVIVSTTYEADLLVRGEDANTELEGIQIYSDEHSINSQSISLLNVTLREYNYTDIPVAYRMFVQASVGEVDTVKRFMDLTVQEETQDPVKIYNYLAIQPSNEKAITHIDDYIVNGTYLEDNDPFGMLVAESLLQKLNASVGSKINMSFYDPLLRVEINTTHWIRGVLNDSVADQNDLDG
ncbi:MAG: hypothetical protein KAR35_04580, partial [Candidatus Heimdallarchaeota archaeon]|nr:hypothetical protein [Candidatus Heimdallarchaeota archaeon]MCK5048631.1 hypothetical protein [Candidatus Heimdallarchaeota archaeon]